MDPMFGVGMTGKDGKSFDSKVANLIAATRHLDIPQVLVVRRLTMRDPESLRWASEKQLNVVFNVILSKAVERTGIDHFRAAREQKFIPLLPDPYGPTAQLDAKVLEDLAMEMLGPPVVMSEHEVAMNKLLTMPVVAAKPATIRPIIPIKEPPPLFTAQLGPDALKGRNVQSRFVAPPPAEVAMVLENEQPFEDFETLFDNTICSFVRKILELFQVRMPTKPGRLPFMLAPEFGAVYEDVLRKMILPAMRASRHIQQLAINHNWAEVGGARLLEILHAGEVNNPVLHNWDSRWAAFRTPKGKKLRAEDNPWPMFREDATRSGYEPPTEDDLHLLKDLIRYELEAFDKVWRELNQLYEQEFNPSGRQEQAREGAFRDGLMKWSSRLPDHVGEFFAIKAYYTYPRLDGNFMRRLITNYGRSDGERRRNAPFLTDFALNLAD